LSVVTNTVTGQVTRFTYDGDCNRVKVTSGVTTTVYVGAHYEVQGATVTKYYALGSQRIAMRQGGTLYYLHADHLGSASLVTYGSGPQVGQEVPGSRTGYYPYGGVRYGGTGLPTDRTFTGQQALPSTGGLMYYGARMYDPAVGRFLSADTVVPSRGDPQGLNRYAYARDNPCRYTDPSGHCWGVLGFVRGLPSYGTTCNNLDMALTIAQSDQTTAGQKAGAVAYIAVEGTAHAAALVGTGILAWEGGAAVVGAVGTGEVATTAGTAATAACADGDCTNEANAVVQTAQSATQFLQAQEAQAASRIIGRDWTVLGKFPGYLQRAREFGANVLNIPADEWARLGTRAQQWARNVEFLDETIARGGVFNLETPFMQGIRDGGSFYQAELLYLVQHGYEWVTLNGLEWLVPVQQAAQQAAQ
jgi:RHS repeat-associated protein